MDRFWLGQYAPKLIAGEQRRFPSINSIAGLLGESVDVVEIPIAHDCTDGFMEAYNSRPEAFLNPAVRRSQSSWTFLTAGEQDGIVERLRTDLDAGEWDRRFGRLRTEPCFEGSLRLVARR